MGFPPELLEFHSRLDTRWGIASDYSAVAGFTLLANGIETVGESFDIKRALGCLGLTDEEGRPLPGCSATIRPDHRLQIRVGPGVVTTAERLHAVGDGLLLLSDYELNDEGDGLDEGGGLAATA